jgi:Mg/Co/Ni transporter MgtE
MGKNKYNTQSWSDYLRDLSNYPNFKLTIIMDDNNGLVAYIPVPRLKRASELQTDDFKALIDAINRGDKASLLTIPGVFTRTMPPRTTNANALRTMEKYGLEAIPVVDKDNRVLAIADRERILSHMILALIGADKI